MIRKLSLSNITCFRKKEFDFADVSIFYGPDGTGKSTIVSAIRQALAGTDETRDTKDLVRRGYGIGSFLVNMFIHNRTYEISKQISDKVSTTGLTPQKLAAELGITKPALELLVDSWTILRKSESELATMIEKALNPNMSKDDIINKILENIKEEKRAQYRPVLDDSISRATGDTITTIDRKLGQRKKEITADIETDKTAVTELTEKLKRTKELNLEKVKAAKAYSDQTTLIQSREKEIEDLKTTGKDLAKTYTEKKLAAQALTVVDLEAKNKELGKTELQIADIGKQIAAIPTVIDLDAQNLPCKWFGKCGLDSDTILEMHDKAKTSNKDKKSKLENQLVLLEESKKKQDDEVQKIRLANGLSEQATKAMTDADSEVKQNKDNVDRLQKMVDDLKATLPKDVESVGSTLMTMAEEVETWTKALTTAEVSIPNREKELKVIDELVTALNTARESLRGTRIDTFKNALIPAVKSIYPGEVSYDTKGLVINGLRHNMLSMSQMHRVGIAIQYALAKSTGIPLMVIDNLNVITNYSNIVPLIQKAIGEGIQVIAFSSLPTIKGLLTAPEGKKLTITTIEEEVPDESEERQQAW
jgi:DNA repair exonuclease SbcCD ATPase subunit